MTDISYEQYADSSDIAIIGMAGRFPDAPDINTFWQNLATGKESITVLSEADLQAAGVSPATYRATEYVKAASILDEIEMFDAAFFGYAPREAAMIDPQQRLFLECAWQAMEDAGYDPEKYRGVIGVFAGAKTSTYLFNVLANFDLQGPVDIIDIGLGNDLANLTTRVSYKLNLKGPSYSLHTACSTSLIAIHLACQSLLMEECQMALAGGVAVSVPQKIGYLYQTGGVLSPDGHCRPFDAQAQGTIFGSGAGVLILKRLVNALKDGDHIYAVIKGTASNNDGSQKASFTAPGVEGQTRVVLDALANAMVDPSEIDYVETHGTGTLLGDSIEIRALTRAFRAKTSRKGYCALGSVKGNIGHLDTAAGISSLIKTILALHHQQLPPSINYTSPNPQIDFENSPFFVNTDLVAWPSTGKPRRAGVSSFGFGSANAHVVLEEAPALELSAHTSREWYILPFSARSATALNAATVNLAHYLEEHCDLKLADVAYTLQVGRQAFNHRRVAVVNNLDQAAGVMKSLDGQYTFTGVPETSNRPVVFMFTGQGAQYPNMGLGLYQTEPVFRRALDRCAELLQPHLGIDIRESIYPDTTALDEATRALNQTALTQPALFAVEYALAQLWLTFGIKPQAMIGHSLGEYVAACLAGVFSLEEALALVALRGRLIQGLPEGTMLAISLNEHQVQAYVQEPLALAAVNGPALCVVSGPVDAVNALEMQLTEAGIGCRRLLTSHAFHSSMLEPILPEFVAAVEKLALKPPSIPFISNVTGTWITESQACDPAYWGQQLRQTVRFADGVSELYQEPGRALLEIGPGKTLTTFARQITDRATGQIVLNSLRHPQEQGADPALLLTTLGKLWLAGVDVDWQRIYKHERRQRVSLPTYPFERSRHWLEPQESGKFLDMLSATGKKKDVADWFYWPTWKRTPALPPWQAGRFAESRRWVIFMDQGGLGEMLAQQLDSEEQQEVVRVYQGESWEQAPKTYTLNPARAEDYLALVNSLCDQQQPPLCFLHLWSLTTDPNRPVEFQEAQSNGFYSLLYLAQGFSHHPTENVQLEVITNHTQNVTGDEMVIPAKATLMGPCLVMPQEMPNITCRCLDISPWTSNDATRSQMVKNLLAELARPADSVLVAYRGRHRWKQIFEPSYLEKSATEKTLLRPSGVYLITGGLGDIGFVIAETLAKVPHAKLLLLGRSAFPDRAEWSSWLAGHAEQDIISQKIRRLQAMEAEGAEITTLRADVADRVQLQAALTLAYQRYGTIHGVFHAAGLVGQESFQTIAETSSELVEKHFLAKVYGVRELEYALMGKSVDFIVLMSSLSAILGGLGSSAYAAANLYLDATAQKNHLAGCTTWLSLNWDAWKLDKEEEKEEALKSFVANAILAEEGTEAFSYLLKGELSPQVVIATSDLQERIDQWLMPGIEHAKPEGASEMHARPNMNVAYVPPNTEYEQKVAAVWQQVLGIESIGIHDNFFELGGHSLLITQLLTHLHKVYPVKISMRDLFENPTVAGMAQVIEKISQASDLSARPLREQLKEVDEEARQPILEAYLQAEAALALHLEPEQIKITTELTANELDVLTGDIQWNLQHELGIQLYPHEIRGAGSIRDLAAFVLAERKRLTALHQLSDPANASVFAQYESQARAQPQKPWGKPECKNPPMIFLHGSPRSGSTLLRVMLAGHPGLCCPPELDILRSNGMGEWLQELTDPDSHHGFAWATQGLQWACVELMGLTDESVKVLLRSLANENAPVEEVYAQLQELASPRVLMDKTPQYSLSLDVMLRAEELFTDPKYILLTRHPYSVIESLVRIRLDKLFEQALYNSTNIDSHVVAEKIWLTCHQNLLEFSRRVDPKRWRLIRYEDLVSDPHKVMSQLCDFLEIAFDEVILNPYDHKSERMLTGIGDPNILNHTTIDPTLGDVWQSIRLPYLLSYETQQLAAELGYSLLVETGKDEHKER